MILDSSKVLRVLQGVSYWVLEDPSEIAELVNTNLKKEWESDMAEHEDPQDRAWLDSLPRRSWRLKRMKMSDIRLNREIMEYSDIKTGYVFRRELEKRTKSLERGIEEFGAVIWPLVLRAEDNQLEDGYCRYHVLLNRNATETYAYVGG